MRFLKISFIFSIAIISICKAQTVNCETINYSGYNLKGESAYILKVSKDVQYGCGSVFGKEIFFKNNHPKKSIKGFIIKKWKYSGYESYDVCEIHYIDLKPGQQSSSLGCDYISLSQPCEFRSYGKFTD